jgi:hypothetical protein
MTKDADFIVPDDALARIGGEPLSLAIVGVTHKIDGVDVDFVSTESWPRYAEAIEAGLERAPLVDGLPVCTPETMVLTKLGQRRKDEADIVETIKAGKCRDAMKRIATWLRRNDPEGYEEFQSLSMVAEWEARGMPGGHKANPRKRR